MKRVSESWTSVAQHPSHKQTPNAMGTDQLMSALELSACINPKAKMGHANARAYVRDDQMWNGE
jgi:hypothetical protein